MRDSISLPLVVVLTAQNGPKVDVLALRPGVVIYMRKPLTEAKVSTEIANHLESNMNDVIRGETPGSEILFEVIFWRAPFGMFLSRNGKTCISGKYAKYAINPMFEQITGWKKEYLIEQGWEHITHPEDLEEDRRNFHLLETGRVQYYELDKRFIKPDGTSVWTHIIVIAFHEEGDIHDYQICLVQDIQTRKLLEKALEESERSKGLLLSPLPGMAYRCNYDSEWTMQFVSEGCLALTGYTPQDLRWNKRLSFNDVILPEYRDKLFEEWKRKLAFHEHFTFEYEILAADGTRKWVSEHVQGIFDADGGVEALEGIILDITERKKYERELVTINEHDQVTGLPNRSALEKFLYERQNHAVIEAKQALVSINIRNVYYLSKSFGAEYSQGLIIRISEILGSLCNHSCRLFTTSPTRFVYHLESYGTKLDLDEFYDKVSSLLQGLLSIERVGWGIGVLELDMVPEKNVREVLRDLLIASEESIDRFEDVAPVCYFDDEMVLRIDREAQIMRELGGLAMGEDNELVFLQYQPILDLLSNQVCGFEELARMQSPQLGLVPPLDFIPVAEKSKLIISIGYHILRKASQFLLRLKSEGYAHTGVSVNISAIQLLKKDFITNLKSLVVEFGTDPKRIIFEVTESVFTSNFKEINQALAELRDYGFGVALDDFGTGYSSFARERELNINLLKIDKYFIDKLMILRDENTITGDIISMAHKLGHLVVAEEVEHESQKKYLERHGCDMIQGYLISRPLDEDAALEFLKTHQE